MPRTLSHRLVLLVVMTVLLAGSVGFPVGTASAHNTLLSSDPADGADLAVAPSRITWTFDNPVPLETLTVTLTNASGERSTLSGSTHGDAGETEVITPLPPLQPGPVSVRWRLVGPDGHPVTGRVDITISTPTPTTASAIPTSEPGVAATTLPPTGSASTTDAARDQDDDTASTPSAVRWLLRYASYLAIMSIVGILFASAFVWAGAIGHPLVRNILGGSLLATAVLGFLQLLVVASDVSGRTPWSSFGAIDAATTTDAGMAFALRVVLALALWLVLFRQRIVDRELYWTAVSLPGLGLLATWAFAGHARSMRWPVVGVATDVAHHAAAAAWIAGLALIAGIVIPLAEPDVLVPAVRRFSRTAAISVAVLVVTGLVQTVRLVGNPTDVFDAAHGRYLVAKIAVLAVMLGLANANRRRIDRRLDDGGPRGPHTIVALRRAILAEFAIGLVIVGITAAMVVSPPSSGGEASRDATPTHQSSILHDVVPPLERPTS